MKINNQELKKILSIATNAINKVSSIEDLACIKISVFPTTNGGAATFITSDNQQTILQSSIVELEDASEKWEVLVEHSLLLSLINKFSKEQTSLQRKENKLIIKNGRNKTKIAIKENKGILNITNLSEKIKDAKLVMEISKTDWLKYFKPVLYATANDSTRPILQCTLLKNTGKTTDLVALDGYRLVKTIIPLEIKDLNCILDSNTIRSISSIISKFEDDTTIKFFKTDSKLFFTILNVSILCNSISEQFINYEQIVPDTDTMNKIEISKQELLDSLERAKIGNDNNLVKLNILNEKLTLTMNSSITNIKEEIAIVSSIKDLVIAFNGKYLSEAIKEFPEEKIQMFFDSSISPCVIKNDFMLALILPVRILEK